MFNDETALRSCLFEQQDRTRLESVLCDHIEREMCECAHQISDEAICPSTSKGSNPKADIQEHAAHDKDQKRSQDQECHR